MKIAIQVVQILLRQASVPLIQAGWKKTVRRAVDPSDATKNQSDLLVSRVRTRFP